MSKPNTMDDLREEIQEFCEEYAAVLEGNGKDYMNKWFNRNYDRLEALITAKLEEVDRAARISELKSNIRFIESMDEAGKKSGIPELQVLKAEDILPGLKRRLAKLNKEATK